LIGMITYAMKGYAEAQATLDSVTWRVVGIKGT
jgi:hypothetical protein